MKGVYVPRDSMVCNGVETLGPGARASCSQITQRGRISSLTGAERTTLAARSVVSERASIMLIV